MQGNGFEFRFILWFLLGFIFIEPVGAKLGAVSDLGGNITGTHLDIFDRINRNCHRAFYALLGAGINPAAKFLHFKLGDFVCFAKPDDHNPVKPRPGRRHDVQRLAFFALKIAGFDRPRERTAGFFIQLAGGGRKFAAGVGADNNNTRCGQSWFGKGNFHMILLKISCSQINIGLNLANNAAKESIC